MPEETQSTPAAPTESAQPSYVQSILGPAGDFGSDAAPVADTTPQTATTTPGTDPERQDSTVTKPGEPTAATTAPTLDDLIQQYAKETGLNPDDPNQRKTLKRLADKELFIQKLQAGQPAAAQPTDTGTTGPELLTAFEQELAAETAAPEKPGEQPQAGKPAETAAPAKPATEAGRYGDIGDDWKAPEDSLKAINDAWADNDLKKVHEIEMARLRRNFDTGIAPQLLQFVQHMLDQRLQGFVKDNLGDVVPEVRRTINERRVAEDREFAIEELRKAGAGEIDKLFTAEDGPPITYEGQEFPNTPLNRILAKHPEIMRITETHSDPSKAQRKTYISRYKLAYQIYKQGAAGVPVAIANKLVEAGRESKERESNDRARQTLNAGKGASGLGDKQPSKSYVHDLNNLPGEVSFGSLIT